METLLQTLARIRASLAALASELAAALTDAAANAARATALGAELDAANDERDHARADADHARAELNNARAELAAAASDAAAAASEIRDLDWSAAAAAIELVERDERRDAYVFAHRVACARYAAAHDRRDSSRALSIFAADRDRTLAALSAFGGDDVTYDDANRAAARRAAERTHRYLVAAFSDPDAFLPPLDACVD